MTKQISEELKKDVNNVLPTLSKNFYDNYPSNKVEIINQKALERFKKNLDNEAKVEDIQFDPLETGLYNDQQIVTHPFIKNMGYHEMSSLAQYEDLYNDYLRNVNDLLNKITNAKATPQAYWVNKHSYQQIASILLTSNNQLSPLANAVMRGGMTLDFENINYFVDYMLNRDTQNEQNIRAIANEFENLQKFAIVKNAEYFVLTTYEPNIIAELYLNSYQISNKVVDTTNFMYKYLDLIQDRSLLSEVGLCSPQSPKVAEAVQYTKDVRSEFTSVSDNKDAEVDFWGPIMAYQDAFNKFKCKLIVKLAENHINFDDVFGKMRDIEKAVKSTPYDEVAEAKSVDARYTFMRLIKDNYISMLDNTEQKDVDEDDADVDDENLSTQTYQPTLQKRLPGYN